MVASVLSRKAVTGALLGCGAEFGEVGMRWGSAPCSPLGLQRPEFKGSCAHAFGKCAVPAF